MTSADHVEPATKTNAPARWRSHFSFANGAMMLCLTLAAVLAWRPFGSNSDAWGHAAIGRWIWTNRAVPHSTLFLFTAHQPWIDHSWLSEIGFYGLLNQGPILGPWLVFLVKVSLVLAVFGTIWDYWRRRKFLTAWAPPLMGMAIVVSNPRFQARPEELSTLFLALLLVFLALWPQRPPRTNWRSWWRRSAGWQLLALFILWANCHGAVALGVLLLLTTAALDLVQEKCSQRSVTLGILALGAALAVSCNPYGFRLWLALAPIHSAVFAWIDEWKPVWTSPRVPMGLVLGQGVLVFVALVAWARSALRRWAELAWLILLFAAFLFARRNGWVCATGALVVMASPPAAGGGSTWRWLPVLEAWGNSAGLKAASLASMLLAITFFWPRSVVPTIVPSALADYLEGLPKGTRIFNHYNQAPYLEWRLGGRDPLFIDAVNAYPDQILTRYLDVLNAHPRGLAWLQSGQCNAIALELPPPGHGTPPVFDYLQDRPEWRSTFLDDTSAVYLRDLPQRPSSGGER